MGGMFIRKRIFGALGMIGVAAILVMTAVPAGAAVVLTTNSAGYGGSASSVKAASATYTVPTVTCHAGENAAVDAQVHVYGTTTKDAAAGVRVMCVKGVETYQAVFAINRTPSYPAITVKAGNRITVSASQDPSKATVTIADLTTHKSVTKSGAGGTDIQFQIVDVGVAVSTTNSALQNVPDFGRMTFSSVTVNAAKVGTFSPVQWERADAKNHVEISTSALSGGLTFTTTYLRSN
jgi:hypothetical protein